MATYNGATMRLFVDGTDVAQVAKAGAIDQDPAVPVSIEAQPQGVCVLDGVIDEMLIYDQSVAHW